MYWPIVNPEALRGVLITELHNDDHDVEHKRHGVRAASGQRVETKLRETSCIIFRITLEKIKSKTNQIVIVQNEIVEERERLGVSGPFDPLTEREIANVKKVSIVCLGESTPYPLRIVGNGIRSFDAGVSE